jgi:large subunit ribosomal protein L25
MEPIRIEASLRTSLGRRAKTVRAQNMIPAVMYGSGVESRPISVPAAVFRKAYAKAGSSALVDVAVEKEPPVKAVIKDVQLDSISLEPVHADFHQVKMTEKMRAEIPLVFTGESAAVKAFGGTLMTPIESVEVECLPADLPHEIEADVSALASFDDAVTIKDLRVHSGVRILSDADAVAAFVERPMTEEEMKKMEESQVGDVAAVKEEGEEAGKEEEKEEEGGEIKEEQGNGGKES